MMNADLPHTHIHTRMKEMKTGTLECKKQVQKSKISHHKNVNKRKICLAPVKLESKKHDKKIIALQVGLGRGVSSMHRGRATSHLSLNVGRLPY